MSYPVEPAVYVGTYHKYNGGSLAGKWMTLSDYADREAFLRAAEALHADEADPELMFQDYEGIPRDMIDESWVSEKVWELIESGIDLDLFRLFSEHYGSDDIQAFQDRYCGKWAREKDFADDLAEQSGYYSAMEAAGINLSYFDLDQFTRDTFRYGDHTWIDGHVFRDY